MRRKDREITDINEISEIINNCDVCRVAFFDQKYPYIVPMNFGAVRKDGMFQLYFHCAKEGMKLELLKKNPHVAFEMDCSHKLILGEVACNSTMGYESVCGNGEMKILEEKDKVDALTIIMNQYQADAKHEFNSNAVKAVEVLELTVDEIHGKRLDIQQ